MKEPILFEEKQYFGSEKIRKFLVFISAVFLLCAMVRWLIVNTFDDKLITASLGLFILSLIFSLISNFCLKTEITAAGIIVSYFPFFSQKTVYWNEVQELFIRKYNPLAEYGGWGIKFGPSGSVYNVRGNIGLQIIFHNGSRLLIGTGKPDEMIKLLQKLGKAN